MSNKKEHKLDGVWDARRVLYNVLFYADEEGYIKYVVMDGLLVPLSMNLNMRMLLRD